MRPKGKLFALLAIFAAIGLVTASGAFTTVEADRTVNVNVAGDSSALLGFSGNSTYATTSGTPSTLSIELNSNSQTNNGGQGVNDEAITKLDYVFTVTNQGTDEVTLTASSLPAGLELYSGTTDSGTDLTNGVSVPAGTSVEISILIDTETTDDSEAFSGSQTTITITAEAN